MKIYLILIFLIDLIFGQGTVNIVKGLFDESLYNKTIYSGYLETNETGNELFYVYMPSQNGTEEENKEPLLLWLNGGPGCSSLIGMLTEIGPVVTKLYSKEWFKNEYAWNKNLNLLFIESPVGVGFTKLKGNITYSEEKTAKDLHVALENFFDLFENLTDREFYISGESYAGVYIPYLTKELIETQSSINLKGILIGNPMTSYKHDFERSVPDFALSHGIIDLDTYLNFTQNCPCLKPERDFREYFGLEDFQIKCEIPIENNDNEFIPFKVTKKCNEIRRNIAEQLIGLDIYGLYRKCQPKDANDNNDYKSFILNQLSKHKHKMYIDNLDSSSESDSLEEEADILNNTCKQDSFFIDFLNDTNTQKKLNVSETNWTMCTPINYTINQSIDFYQEYLPKLKDKVKVWIMSGDTDIILNTLGTKRWIYSLKSNIVSEWEPFTDDEDQICGFKISYENGLTFITAKGAGHMLPEDNPKTAEKILNLFISS